MKDIPIGGFVTIGNEVFKCIKDLDYACQNCDFNTDAYNERGIYSHCEAHHCFAGDREDCEDTIFILYDVIQNDEE